MRKNLLASITAACVVFAAIPQASAISVVQEAPGETTVDEPTQTQGEISSRATENPQHEKPSYLDKPALRDLNEAISQNRQHRRMFADLTKSSGRAETAMTKYIRALDVRYAVLSSVGNSLLKATTKSEVEEGEAVARALLSIRTDLDRAVDTTQMAVIDTARTSRGYFGACDSRGVLADGTKCVMAVDGTTEAGDPRLFWAQPWDADRFEAFALKP